MAIDITIRPPGLPGLTPGGLGGIGPAPKPAGRSLPGLQQPSGLGDFRPASPTGAPMAQRLKGVLPPQVQGAASPSLGGMIKAGLEDSAEAKISRALPSIGGLQPNVSIGGGKLSIAYGSPTQANGMELQGSMTRGGVPSQAPLGPAATGQLAGLMGKLAQLVTPESAGGLSAGGELDQGQIGQAMPPVNGSQPQVQSQAGGLSVNYPGKMGLGGIMLTVALNQLSQTLQRTSMLQMESAMAGTAAGGAKMAAGMMGLAAMGTGTGMGLGAGMGMGLPGASSSLGNPFAASDPFASNPFSDPLAGLDSSDPDSSDDGTMGGLDDMGASFSALAGGDVDDSSDDDSDDSDDS